LLKVFIDQINHSSGPRLMATETLYAENKKPVLKPALASSIHPVLAFFHRQEKLIISFSIFQLIQQELDSCDIVIHIVQ